MERQYGAGGESSGNVGSSMDSDCINDGRNDTVIIGTGGEGFGNEDFVS